MLLSEAVAVALSTHWAGTRKYDTMVSWTTDLSLMFPGRALESLTEADLDGWRKRAERKGIQPPTIYARMSMVSKLYDVALDNGYKGTKPKINRPNVPRKLKWWLKPETQVEAVAWLANNGHTEAAKFVTWTVATGLRVEESLALTSNHFVGLSGERPALTVPGTKTSGAQATLPLSIEAAQIALGLLGCRTDGRNPPLFASTYKQLWTSWDECRAALGLEGEATATLKSFRRSYARERSAKGCPLPLLQQLMRHSDPHTTMEYLRLTGGAFTDAELRPFL
jgi:integrase